MKNLIKKLRIDIDGLARLTGELKTEYNPSKNWQGIVNTSTSSAMEFSPIINYIISNEILQAKQSLLFAKAWLGQMLLELGEETPYKNDGNRKTVEDIEETADKHNFITFEEHNGTWYEKTHIEKVDFIREKIKKIIDTDEDFSQKANSIELEQGFLYKYMCEARFWLGWELQRIKEEIK